MPFDYHKPDVRHSQAGEQLLREYVFIHLDKPADKLALLLQARFTPLPAAHGCRSTSPAQAPQQKLSCWRMSRKSTPNVHLLRTTQLTLPTNAVVQMLGKLYALVDEQCCEDNPDALTSHEVQ